MVRKVSNIPGSGSSHIQPEHVYFLAEVYTRILGWHDDDDQAAECYDDAGGDVSPPARNEIESVVEVLGRHPTTDSENEKSTGADIPSDFITLRDDAPVEVHPGGSNEQL